MLADLVIDTNVLVHAQNPAECRFNDSCTLVRRMLDAEVVLCADEGFSLDSARNRSHIAAEYLEHIRYGSLPFAMLVKLAESRRVRLLHKRAPRAQQRRIQQLIRNTTDRIFLAVAFNSQSRTLVSHDFVDFQCQKRDCIRRELGVAVLEAAGVLEHL